MRRHDKALDTKPLAANNKGVALAVQGKRTLVDAASDAVCLRGAGVFQRVAIFLYAPQALLKVAHNLLGAYNPDDGAAA